MSHYGDHYRAEAEHRLIEAHLPETWQVRNLDHFTKVKLAEGCAAKKELAELKAALKIVVRAAS